MSAAIIVPITVFLVIIVGSWVLGGIGCAVLEKRRNLQK